MRKNMNSTVSKSTAKKNKPATPKPTKKISAKKPVQKAAKKPSVMATLLTKPLSSKTRELFSSYCEKSRAKIERGIKRAAREFALKQNATFHFGEYKVEISEQSFKISKNGKDSSPKSKARIERLARAIMGLAKTKAYSKV